MQIGKIAICHLSKLQSFCSDGFANSENTTSKGPADRPSLAQSSRSPYFTGTREGLSPPNSETSCALTPQRTIGQELRHVNRQVERISYAETASDATSFPARL